jgi:hypothetical protein
MRRSIAIALSVSLTLITFVSTAPAQPPERYFYNTGVVKLGPNQILRLTIDWGDGMVVRLDLAGRCTRLSLQPRRCLQTCRQQ